MKLRLALVAAAGLLVHLPLAHAAARTGSAAPKTIEATVTGRFVEGDQEILELVPHPEQNLDLGGGVIIDQPAGRAAPWSGLSLEVPRAVLVRRQIPPAGEKQLVTLYPAEGDAAALRFTIPAAIEAPSSPALKTRWLRALRAHVERIPDVWGEHAARRIDELVRAAEAGAQASKRKPASNVRVGVTGGRPRPDPGSLRQLMDTTTGLTSLREAVQTDRLLRTRFAGEKPSIPITKLTGPAVAQHPWKAMLAALGRSAPDEPLAHAAPDSFYFLRFASLPHLFRVLDEADAWITPAATMSTGFSQNQELGKRYEAQLGLQRSLASRLLGAQVVTDVAAVGSDPYLREGTDLTLIFRVKSAAGFAAGLASALAAHAAVHGPTTSETTTYGGQTIAITRSRDGVVRQHRATVGAFELVSNSLGAIKMVIDTIAGKHPALADALDFRYLMARDAAVPADVLGFMSDAFVAEVVGPRQKILESRRLLAQADLLVPGYSALLFGWLYGRPPRSLDELFDTGLLERDDLKHGSGEAITFAPGSGARSSWGTVAALTPLIDRPAPDQVTETERDAYRMFAESYQRNWSQYMDPVGLRMKVDPSPHGPLRIDLRVLPIIDASEYRHIQRTVGNARVEVPPLGGGALLGIGVGPQAELRRGLMEMARDFPMGLRSQLDWLGESAFLGVDERFDLKPVLAAYNRENHPSDDEAFRLLIDAPLYAGVAVRNPVMAGVTLGAVRTMIAQAAPGAVDWNERGKHRGIAYVGVSAPRGSEAREHIGSLSLSYAFCKQQLLLSLSETTLKARIDDCLEGRLPKPAAHGKPAAAQNAQLVLALALKKGGPLWQLLGAIIGLGLDDARATAQRRGEILVRGAAGLDAAARRRVGMDYLGGVPVDTEGDELLEDRPPRRGHHHYRGRLAVPPDGSPAYQFVGALARARSEMAFDDEVTLRGSDERLQSLHIVLSTGGAP